MRGSDRPDRSGIRRGSGKKLRAALRWRLAGEGLEEWKAKLVAACPDEAHLIPVRERPEEAEPELWHGLYWRAFDALQFDRPIAPFGGPLPIPYSVISQYARDHRIAGDQFDIFHRLMVAIDDEWRIHVAQDKGGTEHDNET